MNKNLGTNIKTLRKQMNITQEQLAQALNISSQAVSKWETHLSYPDITLLPSIADFFGVSIDFLLGYSNEPEPSNIRNNIYENLCIHTNAILNCLENMDEYDKYKIESIKCIIETLKKIIT